MPAFTFSEFCTIIILSTKLEVNDILLYKYKDVANMFAEIHREMFEALPFVLCTIGEGPQGAIVRPRGLESHQFIWITEGEGEFSGPDKTYALFKGEGIFFRKNVPQRYAGVRDGMYTVWCTFLVSDSVLDYYHVPDVFPFQVPRFLHTSTLELRTLCEGNSTVLSRSSAGYAWLTELLDALFAPTSSIAFQVRQYLESHYAEPLTLDEIARQVHISRFSLCHSFVREQGIPVMEQLKKIRIAKAKQFLRYTAKTAEEIGRLCGFESPSYFGKRFREETGHTPREYRRLHTQ